MVRSAVLIAWVTVMAVMAVRSKRADAPLSPTRELPAEASEVWHGIYAEGKKKIGYSHRVRTPTDDGFQVAADTEMRLSMMGTEQRVRTRLDAETDRSLRLRHFVFHLRSGTIDFALTGTARGDELELRSDSLGEQTMRVPMTTPIALTETLADFIGQETIETGRTFRYALFDPVTSTPSPVTITVGPREEIEVPTGKLTAYRLDQEFHGSQFHLWIDTQGNVVKEEGPLGLTIVREIGERAALAGLEKGGVDLGLAASIPVAKPIASPRTVEHLRIRVREGPALATLSFPPRQTLEGESLLIRREDPRAIRSFPLPADASRFADDLVSTAFLQVDDPQIRRASAEVLDGEQDAERAARKLLDWVHKNLAKVPTISVPIATQVLANRKGDCNEHATLYAALARAAGLPARIVSGIVYMPPDRASPGAFYYHAWNEVWLGEWTAIDPTFGQFPVDATHVALLEGGPDKDVALIGLIGRIRIDVEEAG